MKWAPVQTAAFASHLVADLAIAWENKGRIAKQDGVARDTVIKTAVTRGGRRRDAVRRHPGQEGGEARRPGRARAPPSPRPEASDELKSAQQQLKMLQWAIPAFAAAVIILGAKHGEMQRPKNVFAGLRS